MFSSSFRSSIRFLIKKSTYTLLNLGSLSIGLIMSGLIGIWIYDEVTMNQNVAGSDIFQVYEEQNYSDGHQSVQYSTPGPLADQLRSDFPEVVQSARFSSASDDVILSVGDKKITSDKGYLGDQEIFELFQFNVLNGDLSTFIQDGSGIVLTERMASTLFGSDWKQQEIVGRTIELNLKYQYQVQGVVGEFDGSHTFDFDFIVEFENGVQNLWEWDGYKDWGNNFTHTYLQLAQNADWKNLDENIRGLAKAHFEESVVDFYLIPFHDTYLYSIRADDGRIAQVRIFSLAGLLILLLAGINFANLTTAKATTRSREVGVRKALGAYRMQLATRFIMESMTISLLAGVVSLMSIFLLIPYLEMFTGREVSIEDVLLPFSLVLMLGAGAVGFLSGLYPAMFLSGLNTLKSLGGKVGLSSGNLRRALVILQFTISIGLTVGSIVVYQQLTYMQTKDLGYETDQLVYFNLPKGFHDRIDAFRTDVSELSWVSSVTAASSLPLDVHFSTSNVKWGRKGNEDVLNITCLLVDYDYLETMQMKLADGRGFDRSMVTDQRNYIVNQTLDDMINSEGALGESVEMWGEPGKVIGVVEDFNYRKLNVKSSGPAIINWMPSLANKVILKMDLNGLTDNRAQLAKAWNGVFPEIPFDLKFVDSEIEDLYKSEQQLGALASLFAIVAVVISCLGLIGLASFLASYMEKQMVVRKVLGATTTQLVNTFSRGFIGSVLLSNLVALPVAYLMLNKWLLGYANRVELSIWVFAVVLIVSIVVALITTSFHAFQSAMVNPAARLRED